MRTYFLIASLAVGGVVPNVEAETTPSPQLARVIQSVDLQELSSDPTELLSLGNESEVSIKIEVVKSRYQEEQEKIAAEAEQERLRKAARTVESDTNPSNYEDLIRKYFPEHAVSSAIKIMNCESGGIAKRHNYNPKTKDDSWGLYQINRFGKLATSRPPAEWLVVPENNIKYAAEMYQRIGTFRSTSGWYNCAVKTGVF